MPWLTIIGTMAVGAAMAYGIAVLLGVSIWWVFGCSAVGVLTLVAVTE